MKEPDKLINTPQVKYKARPCFSLLSFGDLSRLLAEGPGVRLLILCLFLFSTSIQAQWTQSGAKLIGTGYVNLPSQGTSVSISADGKTAIVGGHNDNNQQGAAWIYIRWNGIHTIG